MFLFTNAIHLLPYTGAGSGMLRALSEDVNVSFTNNDRTNEFVITINRQISNQPNADSDTDLDTDSDTFNADSDTKLRYSDTDLAYIIHSGFISGYQNRYGDNLKPPTNVYHRMTA